MRLLVINNLRDIPTDRDVGKKTLAVRLGDHRTRWFYVSLLGLAFVLAVVAAFDRRWVLIVLLSLPLAAVPSKRVVAGAEGMELISVLGETGRLQLVFGALATVGLVLG